MCVFAGQSEIPPVAFEFELRLTLVSPNVQTEIGHINTVLSYQLDSNSF